MADYIAREELMKTWESAMQANEVSLLKKNVEQVLKMMADAVFHHGYEELYGLLQSGARQIEAWGNYFGIDENETYCKVFSFSVFWTAKELSEKLYNKCQLEDEKKAAYEEAKVLRSSKYFFPMLKLLEENEELPQGAIAQQLSVSTHALSNFLRRNEKYGLWGWEKYGQSKYYHLTGKGRLYLQVALQRTIQEDGDISQILVYFISCLADELEKPVPDVDNIIHKMNKEFGEKQAVFGNETEKLAIHRGIRRIHSSVKRRERKQESFFVHRELRESIEWEERDYVLGKQEIEAGLEVHYR